MTPRWRNHGTDPEVLAELRASRQTFAVRASSLATVLVRYGGTDEGCQRYGALVTALAAAQIREEPEILNFWHYDGAWPDLVSPGWQAAALRALATAPLLDDSRWGQISRALIAR